MKLKYYLRGLGIGIICTAIIMGIALSGNKRETLTDAEIIERARLLGMVMEEEAKEPAEDEEPPKVRGPLNEKKEEKQEEKLEDSPEPQENGEDDSDTPSEPEGNDDQTPDSQPQEDDMLGTVQFEIKSGEFSDVISQKLFEIGLLADATAFNQYLTQKGADDSLRVGVYQIPKSATDDEIIQILQGKSL